MKALIFEETIVQIMAEEFKVSASLQWIDISGVTPTPMVGWSYDGVDFFAPELLPLDEQKTNKRQEFIAEAIVRIGQQVPEWNTFEIVAYTVSIANLLNLGDMNDAQTLARDIYLYTKNTAFSKIAAVIDQDGLDIIDPTAADPFGDGESWPV